MGMELEQDLRMTSDEMLRMLERLHAMEGEKRQLKPGTERFQELARQVEGLAADIFQQSRDQERLATESIALRGRTVVDPRPIEEVPPTRELHIILSEWRDAERRLGLAEPGSRQASQAQADVQRLREEYRRSAQTAWNEERGR